MCFGQQLQVARTLDPLSTEGHTKQEVLGAIARYRDLERQVEVMLGELTGELRSIDLLELSLHDLAGGVLRHTRHESY